MKYLKDKGKEPSRQDRYNLISRIDKIKMYLSKLEEHLEHAQQINKKDYWSKSDVTFLKNLETLYKEGPL